MRVDCRKNLTPTNNMTTDHTIFVSRRKLVGWLAIGTAFFCAMGIMVVIASGHHESKGWLMAFDLENEWNFPTIFSTLPLFAASAVLAAIAAERRSLRDSDFRYWVALAIIFCFFGIDELTSIHNQARTLVPVTVSHFGLDPRFRWVVAGIVFAFVVGIIFLPFVLRLPHRTRWGMIVSGTIYVAASVGLELVGGEWAERHTKDNWTYCAMVVTEETLEMIGALAFLDVLLTYIERELGGRARLGAATLQLKSPIPAGSMEFNPSDDLITNSPPSQRYGRTGRARTIRHPISRG